jgi:hypothetical protein
MSGLSALVRTLIYKGFLEMEPLCGDPECPGCSLCDEMSLCVMSKFRSDPDGHIPEGHEPLRASERSRDGFRVGEPTQGMIEAQRRSQKRWMVFWGCVIILGIFFVIA